MPFLSNGQTTKLQSGDVMCVDIQNDMIFFKREGVPLIFSEEKYWMMPSEGVQIAILAQIVADVCGLSLEKLGMVGDTWRFKFV